MSEFEEIQSIDMAIESLKECAEVLNEYRYKLLLKRGLLDKMMKANQMHTESPDNECLGDMQ